MKDMLHKEVERHFRPEFLNRVDDIIVFKPLSRENLQTIVDYELAKVFKRLTEHGLKLELTDRAKEFLIEKGYNPEFGARPLRRAIEHYIEDPLSEAVLRGEFKGKNLIKIDVQDEEHLKLEGFEAPAAGQERKGGCLNRNRTGEVFSDNPLKGDYLGVISSSIGVCWLAISLSKLALSIHSIRPSSRSTIAPGWKNREW